MQSKRKKQEAFIVIVEKTVTFEALLLIKIRYREMKLINLTVVP